MCSPFQITLTVTIDTQKLTGKELKINATVRSAGHEVNELNNQIIDIVNLTHHSDLDIAGHSSSMHEKLKTMGESKNISHQIQITNNGPSTVEKLLVTVHLPVSMRNSGNEVIEKTSVSVNAFYRNTNFEVTHIQHSLEVELETDEKRDTDKPDTLTETDAAITSKVLSEPRKQRQDQQTVTQTSQGMNRSKSVITFDCNGDNEDVNECMSFQLLVENFQKSKNVIDIELNFTVLRTGVELLMGDQTSGLVLQSSFELNNLVDDGGVTSLKTRQNIPFTVFYKQFTKKVSYWVYIASGLGGLLLLLALSFGLYKMGFFRRKKKEELEQLVNEEN